MIMIYCNVVSCDDCFCWDLLHLSYGLTGARDLTAMDWSEQGQYPLAASSLQTIRHHLHHLHPPPPPPPSTHTTVLSVSEIQRVLPSTPCIIANPVTNQWQWYFYWAKSPFVRKMLKFPLQYFWESLKNWFSMYLSALPDLRFKLENFIDGKTKSAILNPLAHSDLLFPDVLRLYTKLIHNLISK